MFNRTRSLILTSLLFVSCGENLTHEQTGPCYSDPARYQGSVNVQQSDGSICTATYTTDNVTNTFDCPCSQATACVAAFDYLTAQADTCPGIHD